MPAIVYDASVTMASLCMPDHMINSRSRLRGSALGTLCLPGTFDRSVALAMDAAFFLTEVDHTASGTYGSEAWVYVQLGARSFEAGHFGEGQD